MEMAPRWYNPVLLFIGFALLVNTTASFVGHAFAHASHRPIIAAAACFDMIVLVPAMYYWLVVRRGGQPVATVLGMFCLCAVRASFVFPGVVRSELVVAGAEIGVFAFLFYRVNRALRRGRAFYLRGDITQQLEAAAREMIPVEKAAKVIACEGAIFYYAFFSWGARPHIPAGSQSFSTHKQTGFVGLLWALSALSLIEVPLVHVMVHQWSRGVAWTLTGLGVYGIVWVVALARSVVLHPLRLCGEFLEIRKGFLWSLRIPLREIVTVQRVSGPPCSRRRRGYLRAALGADPQFLVALQSPLMAQGPYGLSKQVDL